MDVAGVEVPHKYILVHPSLDGPQPYGVEHASEEGLGVNSTHFISISQADIKIIKKIFLEKVFKMFQKKNSAH